MTPRPPSTTRPASATTKKTMSHSAKSSSPRVVRTPAPPAPRANSSRAKAALADPAEASRVLDLTLPLDDTPAPAPIARAKPQPKTPPKVSEQLLKANEEANAESEEAPAQNIPPKNIASVARPRAIKRRAPADLVGQYTREEKSAKRAPVALPVEPTKTILRGKAAQEAKEQRRQAMAVNDAVLQRLRNTSAPSSLVVTLPDGPDDVPVKKGRGYEIECGKCGTSRKFSTPATLCARCGTILVKA